MEAIKILIADDHKIFRQGVRAILSQEKDFHVTGEAASAIEIIDHLELSETDLILLDIDLGGEDGVQVARMLMEKYPSVRILALTMHGEEAYIIKMLETGTTGYLLKSSGMEELITAIRTVASGNTYLGKEVTEILIQHMHSSKESDSKKDTGMPLTHREKQILKLIAREYSNSEIAAKLFISIRTVDTHRRNLLQKLKLRNTAGLVKYAIQNKLID
jgi:DNA-binding NarL/FixJ family response regulator